MTAAAEGDDAALRARLSPDALTVRRGRWRFDVRGEEVADVSFDGVSLLRGIRPVVRDQDWNTVPVRVRRLTVEAEGQGFAAVADLSFDDGAIGYRGRITIGVEPTRLRVDFAGRARTAFRRARIGLVVLHPPEDAGRPVDLRTVSGEVVPGRWPTAIAAHQPFRDVAGFGWDRGHVRAELLLHGDVFETEDQRNWTDASFKTYSTPLDQPFPVAVAPGDTVHQSVVLTAGTRTPPFADVGPDVAAGPAPSPVVVLMAGDAVVPELALTAGGPGERLGAPWSALLVELTGPPTTWDTALATALAEAESLHTPLDVRVVTDDPDVVRVALGRPALLAARRLAAFDPALHVTTPVLWQALVEAAAEHGYTGTLVAGARSHFAELNRQFAQLPTAPPLTVGVTPQMHATEVAHIVDSLAGQRRVAVDATRLAAGRAVHVGPVTLRPRFNAVATTAAGAAAVAAPDPLQHSAFAAAWTLGSVAALTHPGVQSLTFAGGPGAPGDVLPRLAALAGRPVLRSHTPPGLVAYPVDLGGGRVEVFLADLTGTDRRVQVFSATTVSAGGRDDSAAPEVEVPGWGTTVVGLPTGTATTQEDHP